MPKAMRYDSQAILVLAPDLIDDARDLERKRVAAGDTRNAFDSSLSKSRIFQNPQVNGLPEEFCQPTTRIYVLGHGDARSTVIGSRRQGGSTWTPVQLYNLLRAWMAQPGCVPARVQRISLLMCYGGGNRGNAPVNGSSNDQSAFTVKPTNSFAHEFACIAGALTVDVTARTSTATGGSRTSNGSFVTAYQTVGAAHRHKGEGDKFIFTTMAGSTPARRANPWYQAAQ